MLMDDLTKRSNLRRNIITLSFNKSIQSVFKISKLGCVVRMVVDSILPHAECGPNDHQKDALPFNISSSFLIHGSSELRTKSVHCSTVRASQNQTVRFGPHVNQFFLKISSPISKSSLIMVNLRYLITKVILMEFG